MHRFPTTLRYQLSVIPAGRRVSRAMEGHHPQPCDWIPASLPEYRTIKAYQVIFREVRLSEPMRLMPISWRRQRICTDTALQGCKIISGSYLFQLLLCH